MGTLVPTDGKNVNKISTLKNSFLVSCKFKLKLLIKYTPKMKSCVLKEVVHEHSAILFITAKTWKQSTYSSTAQ